MKQFRCAGMLLGTAMSLVFISCGGEKKEAETQAVASKDTTAAAPVSTIVTEPQGMTVIRHKVADFAKWKAVYDSHDSARLASGIHSYVIGRNLEDSNMVLVALKVDDLEKAKAFTKDPGLKETMKKGGVTGAPEISFTTVTWQDTENIGDLPRVLTTYSVKDWETWKKAFEEGKQERLDNGIKDRQYGHDADDNHKISVVTAISDTAKANAYWSSDALKKRREAGGVSSEPKRFVFRIIQRY